MAKRANRLFVANASGENVFFFSPSLFDALIEHSSAKPPDEKSIIEFVKKHNIDKRVLSDVARQFGVSKQAVLLWRRRAGIEKIQTETSKNEIVAAMKSIDGFCSSHVREIAGRFGVSATTVERYRREAGVEKQKYTSKRMPSDKSLIVLALNKTWPEFAAVAGMSLAYLRSYVYARPELARLVRAVMVRQAPQKAGVRNAE